ncbi:MAG: alpha-hydroxy-acid oxidizing protein [Xanthomonadaceae bacterium]|jgi:4-hydroxymandelate oxidase|nr:alpha-hydroxy-acid oxidizing protein [Xanthomonadaceae bacterium]
MNARLPPLVHIPAQIAAVADYADYARERMDAAAWAYFSGAAADGITAHENIAAFQRLRLQSRVLKSVADGDTQVKLLGQTLAHPILLAPVAYQRLAHADGELASVLAASAMQAGMIVSAQASVPLEDIAQVAQAPLWFQLYVQHDRPFTAELVQRAESAGYRALVVTVDAPINGIRNIEQRAGFELPPDVEAVNLRGMQPLPAYTVRAGEGSLFESPLVTSAVTWRDIDWLRSLTTLPILLKGILSPRDAEQALDIGVDGIIVSNHGGRVLDTLPAAVDVLPGIVEHVAGRAPVLLDGGIRRGTDVLKALALGADAVLIGRPYLYGLAAAGAVGVAHVLHLLRTELETAMILTGCRTLADVDRQVLWPA